MPCLYNPNNQNNSMNLIIPNKQMGKNDFKIRVKIPFLQLLAPINLL